MFLSPCHTLNCAPVSRGVLGAPAHPTQRTLLQMSLARIIATSHVKIRPPPTPPGPKTSPRRPTPSFHLRWMYKNKDQGIEYSSQGNQKLTAFYDSSFDPDPKDSKCHSPPRRGARICTTPGSRPAGAKSRTWPQLTPLQADKPHIVRYSISQKMGWYHPIFWAVVEETP